MRSFVGFARADEVEVWGWGRSPFEVDGVLDRFESYLSGFLDEEEVEEVVVLVGVMVRAVGFVPRPHEIRRYYADLGQRIALSPWLMEELARRYGGTAEDWEAFFRDFSRKRAEKYARAAALYWKWRDGE